MKNQKSILNTVKKNLINYSFNQLVFCSSSILLQGIFVIFHLYLRSIYLHFDDCTHNRFTHKKHDVQSISLNLFIFNTIMYTFT